MLGTPFSRLQEKVSGSAGRMRVCRAAAGRLDALNRKRSAPCGTARAGRSCAAMAQRYTNQQLARARRLRSEMTVAEAMLWRCLRGHGIGAKFRRQVPIGP